MTQRDPRVGGAPSLADPIGSSGQSIGSLLLHAARACAAAAVVAACGGDHPLSPHELALAKGAAGLGAPTSLSATTAWTTAIQLSWQDRSSNEDGFEVQRSVTGRLGAFDVRASTPANWPNHYDGELSPATQYCYKVRAFRRNGGKTAYSEFSTTECATTFTATAAPSDVKATPTDGYVKVSWTHSATVYGFRLERAASAAGPWSVLYNLQPSQMSVIDWWAVTEQQSCYRVFASGQYGESPPSAAVCTVPPAPPTELTATSLDQRNVDLKWKNQSAFADGYEVRRTDANGVTVVLAGLPRDAQDYRDTGASTDIWYHYSVRAKRDGGFSPAIFVGFVIVTLPPPAPVWMQAVPGGSTAAQISWYDPSHLATTFTVERSSDNWQTKSTVAAVSADPSTENWWVDDYGVASEVEVCYRVTASNAAGEAPPATDCTIPPLAPTDLSAVDVDEYTMEIRWTGNSTVAEGYEVWISTWADFYPVAWATADERSALVPRYWGDFAYMVAARSDGGYSDWACCVYSSGASASQSASLGTLEKRLLQSLGPRAAARGFTPKRPPRIRR